MTTLSDNVNSAITAVLQSASIHMDYVGDLHHGYHDNATQQLRSVIPETTGPRVVNSTLDTTEKQKQPSITSTATGLPDPSAITTAMERMEEDENKEQHADDDGPAVGATAIGIPTLEPILDALKNGGVDDNDGDRVDDDSYLLSNTQKETTTVTSAPVAEARNVIDNLAFYESQKAPSPTPTPMKHERYQPEMSLKQVDPSKNVKLSVDSNRNVQNATDTVVNTDAVEVDSHVHTDSFDASGTVASMIEPTHTIIDSAQSVDPTPVEPEVENLFTDVEAVVEEEPQSDVVTCAVQTMVDPTCPTPADIKTTHLPNMEERTFVHDPISEKIVPVEQVVVTKDLAADEIKVERAPPSESTTPVSPEIKQMENVVVADIKTEEMPLVEEPVTTDDIKIESTAVEHGQHGTIDTTEQQSIVIGASDKDDDEYISTKEDDTKNVIGEPVPTTTTTTTADHTKPHVLPDSATLETNVNESDKPQQSSMPNDSQPRSMNSKSPPPQPSTEQNQAPIDQSQEQSSLEPNVPKSSKCTIM
ncbi:unnamed protein product [Absidia cylindrospora]